MLFSQFIHHNTRMKGLETHLVMTLINPHVHANTPTGPEASPWICTDQVAGLGQCGIIWHCGEESQIYLLVLSEP